MSVETVAIPFGKSHNRQYLTAEQVLDEPYLLNFIARFQNCFEWDDNRCVWWFYPDGREDK